MTSKYGNVWKQHICGPPSSTGVWAIDKSAGPSATVHTEGSADVWYCVDLCWCHGSLGCHWYWCGICLCVQSASRNCCTSADFTGCNSFFVTLFMLFVDQSCLACGKIPGTKCLSLIGRLIKQKLRSAEHLFASFVPAWRRCSDTSQVERKYWSYYRCRVFIWWCVHISAAKCNNWNVTVTAGEVGLSLITVSCFVVFCRC